MISPPYDDSRDLSDKGLHSKIAISIKGAQYRPLTSAAQVFDGLLPKSDPG